MRGGEMGGKENPSEPPQEAPNPHPFRPAKDTMIPMYQVLDRWAEAAGITISTNIVLKDE